MTSAIDTLQMSELTTQQALPKRHFTSDNVQLMLYNAALWNGHRIHFDAPYAKDVEGYPGLVIAGPLLGDWLHQLVEEWLGEAGRIVSMEYSNRSASYIGDTLTATGHIEDIDFEVGRVVLKVDIRNAEGSSITPGTAVVQFLQDNNEPGDE
ncbi:MAG: hydroxyacyl-ACP dehydratase HTD2-like protein with hotdog domain [Glaciecola sp.]|jgi:hydroxyacyl-ACP dehydratase HTD2-like protein with hotdog domain|uniref:hypothetical protein n=1 Tax=Congregibacter sp. TaxID=2744308 RepID=UPI0039E50818